MGELLRSSYEEERSEYDPHNPDIVAFNMRLAQKHANDPFVLLDHDPVRYTFQGAFVQEGSPQPAEVVDEIADSYDPRFSVFQRLAERDPRYERALDNMTDTLRQGGNVVLAMDHGDLGNIAVGMAVVYRDLQKRQVPFRAATVVNAPLQYIGVKATVNGEEYVVPAFTALSLMTHKTYATYADTESTRSQASEFVKQYIEIRNKQVLVDLAREKREGGLLLGIAASGRIDRAIDDTIVLGSVSNGTVRLLTKGRHEHIVYIAARGVEGEDPVFEVVREDYNPWSKDFHTGYHELARVLSMRTGKKFIYEGPRRD